MAGLCCCWLGDDWPAVDDDDDDDEVDDDDDDEDGGPPPPALFCLNMNCSGEKTWSANELPPSFLMLETIEKIKINETIIFIKVYYE